MCVYIIIINGYLHFDACSHSPIKDAVLFSIIEFTKVIGLLVLELVAMFSKIAEEEL